MASAHEFTTEKYFATLLNHVHGDHILEIRINKILNAIKTRNEQGTDPIKTTEEESLLSSDKQKTETEQRQPDETLKMENPASVKTDAGEIYIENAGLVLLHPFLMNLFENIGLVEDEKWHDDFCQQKAVLILQYLAKGISPADEHELVLNKIMCGLKPEDVINTALEVEAETKIECENLLAAVIEHWRILRNTSVESLRETFLQRSAKLSVVDQGWLLQVEQKSFDVLLNHLPWGIGIVKIPVMNEMLFVEWA
ncbi:MAG: contractile injection system tape measure protein [Bacteroidales bacterium]